MLALFFAIRVNAQDTNYVSKYDNLLTLKTFVYNDGFGVEDKRTGLKYIPGFHSGIGIGFYFKYIPFDFSLRKEFSDIGDSKYHKKTSTYMQLKGYSKLFAGDIFIQKYTGFYTGETKSYKVLQNPLSELEFNPDLSLFLLDAVGKYIFNHEKFSYKAGFTPYEKQLISAGSPIAGVTLHFMHVKSDSSLVYVNNSSDFQTLSLGINVGYAYNFVFGKRSTLFLSWLGGLNGSNLIHKNLNTKNFTLWPSIYVKGAYWMNFDKWSWGITAISNYTHQVFDKDIAVYMNSIKIDLVLVRRLCCYKTK